MPTSNTAPAPVPSSSRDEADNTLTQAQWAALAKRLGPEHLQARRLRQERHRDNREHQGGSAIAHLHRFINIHGLACVVFWMLGLYARGRRNFLSVQLERNEVRLPHLPAAFEGFRVLHLTDLHADNDPELADVLAPLLVRLEYDVCVITGDYRNCTRRSSVEAMRQMRRIAAHLKPPIFGTLGNHDFIEKTIDLEAMGIRMLLNEATSFERGGERLYLAGIDDAAFYGTWDLKRARREIPSQACALLLSHSPDTYAEAEAAGFAWMLSGHTHGGQICLPGGRPVFTHSKAPRQLAKGPWQWKGLQGYTSRGTGGCGAPLRYQCPPEITLHTLHRGDPKVS
ncbi:MAG: metallophosphoesterase [Opitutales bacterium]